MKRLLPRRPRRHRAEQGLRGYRGMIAVIVMIALVAVLALTGTFRRGLCALDPDSCTATPSGGTNSTYFGTGALPAASDERAVATGVGLDAVPPGRHKTAAGKAPALTAGLAASLEQLWTPLTGVEQAGMADTTVLIPLEEMACGTSGTGPCDTWEGLQSDSTAEHTQGADRLSLLGLDPFVGIESETSTLDLTLANSPLRQGGSGSSAILYRHSQRLRDGATTETWAWQASPETAAVVSVERLRGGLLHSVKIIGATTGADNQVIWTTICIPVTDSSREALDQWVSAFTVDGPALPDDLWEPTAAVGPDDDVLLRLVHATGQVTREALSNGDGSPGVTPQVLRDDPEHASAGLAVTSTETLAEPDALGRREFKAEEDQ
ncbi:hypothetical protein [Actinomyces sp.]|uniref:hypothetical protein n=1 Tax=Actinomyces sp. TaxID=29317 RepID=UPI0026DC884C|nr:hypothetical protein [Actinomyces sp.]MDO4901223.1 hypothetical protein [Actinomyces sp.]